MGRVKKLKGWNYNMFLSEDEKLLALVNNRNGLYVHDLDSGEIAFQAKSVSNIAHVVVSKDRKYVAAKNTSGTLAIISMETGEEICRNNMAKTEGWRMTFDEDGCSVLDFDHDGRTMLLTQDGRFTILDGPGKKKSMEMLPYVYIRYDQSSGRIYKFMNNHPDFNGKFVLTSAAEKDHISYEVLQKVQGPFPDAVSGVSFCRDHIYFGVNKYTGTGSLIVVDRQFNRVDEILLPLKKYVTEGVFTGNYFVSPGEKYVLFKPYAMGAYTYLFDIKTRDLVREFDHPYVSGFTMIKDDTVFLISTWEGTYMGGL